MVTGRCRGARPTWHWFCGGGRNGEPATDDGAIDNARCGSAGADAGADWGTWGDDLGVQLLGERGNRVDARVDLEVASDDERESARAGDGAEHGEDFAVFVGEAAACD